MNVPKSKKKVLELIPQLYCSSESYRKKFNLAFIKLYLPLLEIGEKDRKKLYEITNYPQEYEFMKKSLVDFWKEVETDKIKFTEEEMEELESDFYATLFCASVILAEICGEPIVTLLEICKAKEIVREGVKIKDPEKRRKYVEGKIRRKLKSLTPTEIEKIEEMERLYEIYSKDSWILGELVYGLDGRRNGTEVKEAVEKYLKGEGKDDELKEISRKLMIGITEFFESIERRE